MLQLNTLLNNNNKLWESKTAYKAENYLNRRIQQLCEGAKLLTGIIGSTIFWSTIIRGALAADNPLHAFARRAGSPLTIVGNITNQQVFAENYYSLSILPSDYFKDNYPFTLKIVENETLPSWLSYNFDSLIFQGSYELTGSPRDVKVVNSIAYIAYGTSGLQIFDVSNPKAPAFLGAYDSTSQFQTTAVEVVDNIAFTNAPPSGFGLTIIDVNNSSNPISLANLTIPNFFNPKKIQVLDHFAYVIDSYSGLKIINVSNLAAPSLKGTWSLPNENILDLAVADNLAYLAYTNGLYIIDVSDSSNPTLLGTYSGTYNPGYQVDCVDVVGNFAYIATAGELQILNVTNSSAPTLVGGYNIGLMPYQQIALEVVEEIAFVSGQANFYVDNQMSNIVEYIDVSNPYTPRQLGIYNTFDTLHPISSLNNEGYFFYLLQGTNTGLLSLDILEERFTLTGNPGISTFGNHSLELIAQDSEMNQASIPFVLRVDSPPLVNNSIPDQVAKIGQTFIFEIPNNTFIDPSGYPLTLFAEQSTRTSFRTSLPAWLSFVNNTLEGIPGNSDIGNYSIIISAQDPAMNQASTNFGLRVESIQQSTHSTPSYLLLLLLALPVPCIAGAVYKYYNKKSNSTNKEMIAV